MFVLACLGLPLRPAAVRPLTQRSMFRALHGTSARWADVLDPVPPKPTLEQTKEAKLRQYAQKLQTKAAQRGLKSVEELKSTVEAEQSAETLRTRVKEAEDRAKTYQQDKELAERIRAKAQEEVSRRLERGELGPKKDEAPIRPLSDFVNVEKLGSESPENVRKLWTAYHQVKNQVSAVIPVDVYAQLLQTARKYPQFILPLPKAVVTTEDGEKRAIEDPEAVEDASKTAEQGFEMYFLQWAFLPAPADGGPAASTVLFTPLAEYKLRQEFAQPLLVLTHYPDLAQQTSQVLMRGEITDVAGARAAPTGVAAAMAARARGASPEEQARLSAPLQTDAQFTVANAGLLASMLQRFYLSQPGQAHAPTASGETRRELLDTFQNRPHEFDLDALIRSVSSITSEL